MNNYRFFKDPTGKYMRVGNYMASLEEDGIYVDVTDNIVDVKHRTRSFKLAHMLKKPYLIEITADEAYSIYPCPGIDWSELLTTRNESWTIDK